MPVAWAAVRPRPWSLTPSDGVLRDKLSGSPWLASVKGGRGTGSHSHRDCDPGPPAGLCGGHSESRSSESDRLSRGETHDAVHWSFINLMKLPNVETLIFLVPDRPLAGPGRACHESSAAAT